MASKTAICNMALGHLGVGQAVANVDTERSAEANACRTYYDAALEATLAAFAWPFATKIDDLALVEADPNDEWAYSYQVPSDCLEMRRLLSGIRNDSRDTRVPYRIAHGTTGQVIFTDLENAQAEYTVRVTDTNRFASLFALALSFRLASYIAPKVTSGDPYKLGDRAMRFFDYEVSAAEASAANGEQPDQEPDSEFIRTRE
jgi:hypothetical protein